MVGKKQVVAVGRVDEWQRESGWEACEQVEIFVVLSFGVESSERKQETRRFEV
jgi:hypothetical protein